MLITQPPIPTVILPLTDWQIRATATVMKAAFEGHPIAIDTPEQRDDLFLLYNLFHHATHVKITVPEVITCS